MSANEIKQLEAKTLPLTEPIVLGGQISTLAMQWLEQAIAMIEREVHKYLEPRPEFQLLTTVPGIGQALRSAKRLVPPSRWKQGPSNASSYARCVKTEKISNGKYKGRGNSKNGNKYLAWAFMEAAHYAAIWSPQIKSYYQRKQAKCHILVAKKAVANKLARACYHMLRNQEPFDVKLKRAFG